MFEFTVDRDVKMNFYPYGIELKAGDVVEITEHFCEECGGHKEIDIVRGGKRVAHVGDYVRLIEGKEEVLGDVVKREVR